MDTKEHRLGNLVNCYSLMDKDKEDIRVGIITGLSDGVCKYDYEHKHGFNHSTFNNIPITEEWLVKKAGFIKVNGWDDIILFIKDGIELEFVDGRFYNHCDTELKYVHQVQNYYYSSKLMELQINK